MSCLKNIEEIRQRARQTMEEHAAELADMLFAVEPDTGNHTRRLYFADEIPEHSDAGQKVHA
jgi:hypothetical protein